MADELLAAFERMLEAVCPPAVVRAIGDGLSVVPLWIAIAESGFLDALIPAERGGPGLDFAEVGALARSLGRHLTPVPVAQTIAARALLASAGIQAPEGQILLVTLKGQASAAVPMAALASHALVETDGRLLLCELAGVRRTPAGVAGSQSADLEWEEAPAGPCLPLPPGGLRPIAAVLRACEIAGACDRLLEMTVTYANQRSQFGKPIGRQQAVQQQMAVMAEQVMMARIAAEVGCAGSFPPPMTAVATAKLVASAAAARVGAIAHAVHGAIGLSEELDLQLYTRRLIEWRLADGSESYWARLLGRARLGSGTSSLDAIRAIG